MDSLGQSSRSREHWTSSQRTSAHQVICDLGNSFATELFICGKTISGKEGKDKYILYFAKHCAFRMKAT